MLTDLAESIPPVWGLIPILAGFYALALVVVGGAGRTSMVALLAVSLLGFVGGQVAADALGWEVLSLGDVHLLEASLGSWLLLLLVRLGPGRAMARGSSRA